MAIASFVFVTLSSALFCLCFSTPALGNLLKGIVIWSGVAYKAQNSPFDNKQFFFISTETKNSFLQTMLAIYGFHSKKKLEKIVNTLVDVIFV